jgi:hypothetical protein
MVIAPFISISNNLSITSLKLILKLVSPPTLQEKHNPVVKYITFYQYLRSLPDYTEKVG